MKQKLRLLMMTLLCAVVSTAWAGENEVYKFAFKQQSGPSNYGSTYTVTIGGKSWTIPGNMTNGDYLRIGGKSIDKVDRVIQCNDELTGNISKIVFNHNGKSRANVTVHSVKVTVANDAAFTNIVDEVTVSNPTVEKDTEGSIDFTPNPNKVWSGDLYYKFTVNISNPDTSNGGLDLTSLVFYESVSGAVDPVVNFANESEEIEVGETVTNTLTKPNDLTVTYSSDPTSVATVDEDGVVTGVAEGEAEITASWEAVANKYNAGSVSYTVTVNAATTAVNYVKVTNANQLLAGNEYIIVGSKASTTAAMGARTGTNTYRDRVFVTVTDDKVAVKNKDGIAILTLGGESGAWTFKASDNNEYLALTANSNALHSSADVTDNTKWTITDDFQVKDNNYDRFIQYNSGATRFACYTSGQGESYLYVKEGSSTSTEPSITVNTTSIDIPAEGADGTIEVTFTNVDPELTEVVFYDADGTTVTTCNWIITGFDGNNIEYVVDENEGEARTAYLKVYSLDNDGNDVYSELITITQAAAPAPSISVASTNVELTAAAGDGSIEVTYTRTEPYDVAFYEEDGETAAEYDWIEADFDESNNIYYIVEENTSNEARTAYLKIVALGPDGDDFIYSDLITITQAAPTAPVEDYATLPFEFDGGKADIEDTSGLTQEGLDSDYGSSPKLKFNGTGDYVILKFNERPGKLTFDLKGNSFSGGTFTVQTSEDGETYTDLKTYNNDNFNNTVHSETFEYLGKNVRYIKWIYTNKASGNVALGNIVLAKYEEPQPYTVTITQPDNAEIFVFYNDPYNNWPEIQSGDEVLAGSEVMVSTSASEGYQIENVTVTDENEQEIELTEAEEGISWTFIMPKSDVTIACTVTEIPEPSDEEWVLTDFANLTEDDIFVIVGNNGKTYAMSNDKGTSAAPTAVSVTISGDKITSAVADNIKWNISGNDADGYIFYPNGDEETWLYTTNDNNGVRVGTSDNKTFTINNDYLYNTVTGRYVGIYNSQAWRCYTSINSNIKDQTFGFYKLVKPLPDPFTFTIDSRAADESYYYATIADLGEGYFKVVGDMEVRTATILDGKLSYPTTYYKGDVFPGNGAYLVVADKSVGAGQHTFPAVVRTVPNPVDNMLYSTGSGSLTAAEMEAKPQEGGNYLFYKLSLNGKSEAGSVGFYWGAPKGAAFNYTKAHQAFLAVPQTGESIESGDDVAAYLFDGDKTGIYNVMATESESNDDTYTLSGIRVENKQLPKGIYIKNGKKVVVK